MDLTKEQLAAQNEQLRLISTLSNRALSAYESVNAIIKNQTAIHNALTELNSKIDALSIRLDKKTATNKCNPVNTNKPTKFAKHDKPTNEDNIVN